MLLPHAAARVARGDRVLADRFCASIEPDDRSRQSVPAVLATHVQRTAAALHATEMRQYVWLSAFRRNKAGVDTLPQPYP